LRRDERQIRGQEAARKFGDGFGRFGHMAAPFALGAARLFQFAGSIAVIPVLLRHLGREEFALFMALTSLFIATAFLDLGLGGSLVNRLSAPTGTRCASNRAVSSSVVGLSLFWGLAATLLLVLYPVIDWNRMFGLARGAGIDAGPPAILMLVGLCAVAPLGLAGRIRLGLGRVHVQSFWDGTASALSLAGMLLIVSLGGGLTMVVFALISATLISLTANWAYLLRSHPWLAPRWRNASWATFTSMFYQSGSFFVIALCNAVAFGCDSLIAISILGARPAAEAMIALRLVSALQTLMAAMALPYWPRLSRIGVGSVADRKRTLRETFIFIFLISAGAAGALLLLGPLIVKLWTAGAAELPPDLRIPIAIWIFVFGLAQGLLTVFCVDHLVRTQLLIVAISAALILVLKIGGAMLWGAPGLVLGGTVALVCGAVVPLAALLARDLRSTSQEVAHGHSP